MEFQGCLHCMSVQSTEKNEQVIMNAVQSDSAYLSWALLVLSFVLFVCLFFCRFALFLICCCLS